MTSQLKNKAHTSPNDGKPVIAGFSGSFWAH
jgi:hypothetical protein